MKINGDFFGKYEKYWNKNLSEGSPVGPTRVGARPTPLGAPPYLVAASETPWLVPDAKNSYKYRNLQKIT